MRLHPSCYLGLIPPEYAVEFNPFGKPPVGHPPTQYMLAASDVALYRSPADKLGLADTKHVGLDDGFTRVRIAPPLSVGVG